MNDDTRPWWPSRLKHAIKLKEIVTRRPGFKSLLLIGILIVPELETVFMLFNSRTPEMQLLVMTVDVTLTSRKVQSVEDD